MKNDRQTGSNIWWSHFLDKNAPSLILLIALILGLFIWVADAALDYFVFYKGGFLELLLLNPPQHEIYIRFLFLLCFLGFGGVVAKVVLNLQATRKELQNKETNLRTTLHSLGEAVIATDASGRIQRMNERSERLTGWDLDEVQGLPLEDVFQIFNAVSREPVADPVRIVLEKGTIQGFSNLTVLIARDGTEYQIEDSASPIRDEQGKITGVVIVFRDVTQSYQMQAALEESEQKYRSLFENMRDAFLLADTERNIYDCNPAFESLFGYSLEEIRGKETSYVYENAEEFQKLGNAIRENINSSSFLMTVNYKKKNGEVFPGETGTFYLKDQTGKVVGFIGAIRDITVRKQLEEELRKREGHLQAILQATPDPLVVYDSLGHPEYINSSFSQLFGWTLEELQGRRIPFVPEDQKELTFSKIREIYATGIPVTFDTKRLTKDNRLLDIRVSAAIIQDLLEGHYGLVVILTDITEYKQMEERLREISFYDSLTGLYNRNFFEEEMKRLNDRRCNPMGIIVCDLDGMKFINDTLGHQSGDHMLINTADILRRNFRSSDIIARIGGDEFAILLPKSDSKVVEQLLQRLRQVVEDYNNTDPEIPLFLSLGHTVSEEESIDMQTLFREADARMYREKIQYRGSAPSAIFQALTRTMQAKDFYAEGHSDHMQELCASMAFSLELSRDIMEDLTLFTRYHDLGKVGIPDHILFKPGALTEREWQQVRQHCEIGHRIAYSVPGLEAIGDYILKHHEWWNGQGYPLGLSGQDIPLACRVLALADAYDVMTNNRPYRKTLTQEEAIAELRRFAGTQFDPELVEPFIQIIEQRNF